MAPLRPFDLKPVGRENLRQAVAGRPGFPVGLASRSSRTAVSTSRSRLTRSSQLVKVQPGGFHERHDIPHTMASPCSGRNPRRRRRGRLPGDGAFDLVVAA